MKSKKFITLLIISSVVFLPYINAKNDLLPFLVMLNKDTESVGYYGGWIFRDQFHFLHGYWLHDHKGAMNHYFSYNMQIIEKPINIKDIAGYIHIFSDESATLFVNPNDSKIFFAFNQPKYNTTVLHYENNLYSYVYNAITQEGSLQMICSFNDYSVYDGWSITFISNAFQVTDKPILFCRASHYKQISNYYEYTYYILAIDLTNHQLERIQLDLESEPVDRYPISNLVAYDPINKVYRFILEEKGKADKSHVSFQTLTFYAENFTFSSIKYCTFNKILDTKQVSNSLAFGKLLFDMESKRFYYVTFTPNDDKQLVVYRFNETSSIFELESISEPSYSESFYGANADIAYASLKDSATDYITENGLLKILYLTQVSHAPNNYIAHLATYTFGSPTSWEHHTLSFPTGVNPIDSYFLYNISAQEYSVYYAFYAKFENTRYNEPNVKSVTGIYIYNITPSFWESPFVIKTFSELVWLYTLFIGILGGLVIIAIVIYTKKKRSLNINK